MCVPSHKHNLTHYYVIWGLFHTQYISVHFNEHFPILYDTQQHSLGGWLVRNLPHIWTGAKYQGWPAALLPWKELPVPIGQQAEWAPEPVWMTWREEESCPYQDSNSTTSAIQACSQSLYRLCNVIISIKEMRTNVELRTAKLRE
jgi:hypothetical protein